MSENEQPEQVRVRAAKRQRLLDAGIDPYPVTLPITRTIAEVRAAYGHLVAGEETDDVVALAGRVMYLRNTGKLCFTTLQDGEGNTLQVMVSAGEVGAESLAAFKADVDLGDHLFVRGRVISSRRGELSVFAAEWRLASKALRPLPIPLQKMESHALRGLRPNAGQAAQCLDKILETGRRRH